VGLVFNPSTMGTGVDSVDSQHRQLFDIINRLSSDMAAGKGKDEVGRVLDELAKYAVSHFAHEEGCMVRFNCPVASQNKAAHAAFIQTFTNLKAEFDRTGPTATLAMRVQQEISKWITSHIVAVDVKMKPCVPAGVKA
jgi:hemerythrin-like metal-binding protein